MSVLGDITFALEFPGRPNKVALWCRPVVGAGETFEVINGGWRGQLHADGTITAVGSPTGRERMRAAKIWEGVVPPTHDHDYNLAIAWIEAALDGIPEADPIRTCRGGEIVKHIRAEGPEFPPSYLGGGNLIRIQDEPTLRDQFAMAALNGLLSDVRRFGEGRAAEAARRAYQCADAMMEARKK